MQPKFVLDCAGNSSKQQQTPELSPRKLPILTSHSRIPLPHRHVPHRHLHHLQMMKVSILTVTARIPIKRMERPYQLVGITRHLNAIFVAIVTVLSKEFQSTWTNTLEPNPSNVNTVTRLSIFQAVFTLIAKHISPRRTNAIFAPRCLVQKVTEINTWGHTQGPSRTGVSIATKNLRIRLILSDIGTRILHLNSSARFVLRNSFDRIVAKRTGTVVRTVALLARCAANNLLRKTIHC